LDPFDARQSDMAREFSFRLFGSKVIGGRLDHTVQDWKATLLSADADPDNPRRARSWEKANARRTHLERLDTGARFAQRTSECVEPHGLDVAQESQR
jgi:hypothetical protein